MAPTAANQVAFVLEAEGKTLGLDSGDPQSHEGYRAPRRKAFNGTTRGPLAYAPHKELSMNTRCLALLAAALCSTSCVIDTAAGPVRHDARSIERDAAEQVRVDLHMGAGTLIVGGGARKLLNADFTYDVASWQPEVRYSSTGTRGDLTIRQPEHGHARIGRTRYQWDLALNNEVPMDLALHFGAGAARLDLGSLSLRSVEVDMGVGKLDMDLRGFPKHNYDVRIRGGVGEATIRLPAGVGVYAEGRGGIGEIRTEGLRREGGHWVNDAYEDSNVKINLDIHGGIGSIRLIAD